MKDGKHAYERDVGFDVNRKPEQGNFISKYLPEDNRVRRRTLDYKKSMTVSIFREIGEKRIQRTRRVGAKVSNIEFFIRNLYFRQIDVSNRSGLERWWLIEILTWLESFRQSALGMNRKQIKIIVKYKIVDIANSEQFMLVCLNEMCREYKFQITLVNREYRFILKKAFKKNSNMLLKKLHNELILIKIAPNTHELVPILGYFIRLLNDSVSCYNSCLLSKPWNEL